MTSVLHRLQPSTTFATPFAAKSGRNVPGWPYNHIFICLCSGTRNSLSNVCQKIIYKSRRWTINSIYVACSMRKIMEVSIHTASFSRDLKILGNYNDDFLSSSRNYSYLSLIYLIILIIISRGGLLYLVRTKNGIKTNSLLLDKIE